MNMNMIKVHTFLGLFVLILLVCPALVGAERVAFPPGFLVGTITGTGGEQLTRLLQKYETTGPRKTTLGGQLSWNNAATREQQTVLVERPFGQATELYKPDPFTAKLWLTEEINMKPGLESYELQRFSGSVVFNWQLDGAVESRKGQADIELDRVRGGYLAQKGLAPTLGSEGAGKDELEERIVKELVLMLLLDLGRHPDASEIESGSDPLSSQAKKLAVSGDWEGARKIWEGLLKQNPKYGSPLFNSGLYYERKQQPEEAWRYYRAAFLSQATDTRRATLTRLTGTLGRAERLPTRTELTLK